MKVTDGSKISAEAYYNRSLATETQDITKSSLQAIKASPAVDKEELSVQGNNILKIPYWLLSRNAAFAANGCRMVWRLISCK